MSIFDLPVHQSIIWEVKNVFDKQFSVDPYLKTNFHFNFGGSGDFIELILLVTLRGQSELKL